MKKNTVIKLLFVYTLLVTMKTMAGPAVGQPVVVVNQPKIMVGNDRPSSQASNIGNEIRAESFSGEGFFHKEHKD